MRTAVRLSLVLYLLLNLCKAYAVPSFARQTGLSCNVCHRNPPELTQFGRNFKLRGYSLRSAAGDDNVGSSKDLSLSKFVPISVMALLSNTAYQSNQPASQNNSVGFPQQLSIFFAGSFATHFGGMAQVTYSHADDHFGMDNTDLRFASSAKIGGHGVDYGITLNNNPSVEDLWNSTPAWGFPWISTASGVSPIASPVINGALAQDVAGIGGYGMWSNRLYTNVTLYRSEHAGAATPVTGVGSAFNIAGVAPYWRAAWQNKWSRSYLEFGAFGIDLNSFPNSVSGPKDRYVDSGFDFQYSRPIGANEFDAHGSYVRENSELKATSAAGGANRSSQHLNAFKLDAIYHWTHKYSATAAMFSTTGPADPLLYAQAPLTGSNNGSPNTSGYLTQFSFWPAQNIDINLNYTGYMKFNGASANYDGANRNASDNNSVYMAVWLNF